MPEARLPPITNKYNKMQSLLRPKYFHSASVNLRSLTYCWKCNAPINAQSLFCNQISCNVLQPFSLDKNNIFQVFKLKEEFDIDNTTLSLHFKDLQRLLHPDKFATRSVEERDYSANASSSINQAYNVISSITFYYWNNMTPVFLIR